MFKCLIPILFASIWAFPSLDAQAKTVQALMTHESLGLQRSFFEKTYGPAKKRLYKTSYLYVVKGCNVIVEFDADNGVKSIELTNLSNKCTFNTKSIFLDGPAHKLTYEKLISYSSIWEAQNSCYEDCGNALDPDYGALVELPRSSQFLVVKGTSNYGIAGESSWAVLKELKASYPDLYFSGVECLDEEVKVTYNKVWFRYFKALTVTSLKFSGSRENENCT